MIKEQFSLVEYLIQRLHLEGIEDIVISPGSRNAPIIEALVSFNKFKLHSIIDERSAAFFALGCTIQTKKTTVLVCTSGSAVLNYAPGISEAFYQGRPLIVISADRPESFVGQMAGQTIHQQNCLGNFVKSFEQLSSEQDFNFLKRKIENGLLKMTEGLKGPIHFNIPFQEPFYGYDYQFNHTIKKVKRYNNITPSDLEIKELNDSWNSAKRIMILTGCLDPDNNLSKELDRLSNDKRVVILSESTSNLNIEKNFVSIDNLMIQVKDQVDFEPHLLITLGRNVVSKKIKAFLAKSNIVSHWSFDLEDHCIDTYGHLSHKVQYKEEDILSKLEISEKGDYYDKYLKLDTKARTIQSNYLQNLEFCDYKAFDEIFRAVPENTIIHFANSSVVRYGNLFNLKSKNIEAYANRGTSGIDGSTSTAVGFAIKSKLPNLLITGDISFLYDSNGLWNTNIPDNLKIIVINNGGGGIFDIIDGAKDSEVNETYLKTSHSSIPIKYKSTQVISEKINAEISTFFNAMNFKQLEIITTKSKNAEYLTSFLEELNLSE